MGFPRNILYQRRFQYLRNVTYQSNGFLRNNFHALLSENGVSDSLKMEAQTLLGNDNSLDSTSEKNSTAPLATFNDTLNSETSHVYQEQPKSIVQSKRDSNAMNFNMLSEESKRQSCVRSMSYIGELHYRLGDGKSDESLEIFQDIKKLKLKGDKSLFFLPGIVSRMCQHISELEECHSTMLT